MTRLDVALENYVPLNQQQRESKPVIVAEVKRLQAEIEQLRANRDHWKECALGYLEDEAAEAAEER